MSAKDVVEESARLMKGNKSEYFLLQLSFIGWAILAAFTCGIGLIFLTPYMQLSSFIYYEDKIGKFNVSEVNQANTNS